VNVITGLGGVVPRAGRKPDSVTTLSRLGTPSSKAVTTLVAGGFSNEGAVADATMTPAPQGRPWSRMTTTTGVSHHAGPVRQRVRKQVGGLLDPASRSFRVADSQRRSSAVHSHQDQSLRSCRTERMDDLSSNKRKGLPVADPRLRFEAPGRVP
jgi:hypothetical protein